MNARRRNRRTEGRLWCRRGYSYVEVASDLYRGILDREPDQAGLSNLLNFLRTGNPLEGALRALIESDEFHSKALKRMIPSVNLPDLRQIIPEYYRNEGHCVVFQAQRDDDFNLLERLITQYHYYDRPGVWGSRVDTDKKVTAALVSGLSASSCLEIGCFTGPVLSLLEEMGLDVAGIETSHLAFSLAYPNILNRMTFGDLLSVPIAHLYDVVLAMDVLEHLNPVKLGGYIDKIASTLSQDGYAVVNSPMFGVDDVFGSVFPAYLKEWRSIGDTAFWRDLDCDGLGWPKLGHLVWASPRWWERMFAERGLFRDRGIEAAVQGRLKTFFVKAPGRRCLFILRREDNRRQSADVARSVMSAIDALPW